MRAFFSRWRLDRADLHALKLLAACTAIVVGIAMMHIPAALIAGGVGYLGLAIGLRRGWL